MNLEQERSHHAPRRTHSFDSYDSLDRLEELRRRKNEFFANRAKFERRQLVPTKPPPPVPGTSESRAVSPTSRLIQGFTDKLKTSAVPDSTASDRTPALPRRSPAGKMNVISVDSPRKYSYKTTCHVFPTFNAPSDDNEDSKHSNQEETKKEVPLSKPPRRQWSFNSIDDIMSSSLSRQNSFKVKRTSKDMFERQRIEHVTLARPFQRPLYDRSQGCNPKSDSHEPPPENPRGNTARYALEKPKRLPIIEPRCIKHDVGVDGYNYATPFQDTVDIHKLSANRGEFKKLSVEDLELVGDEGPVPPPRRRKGVPQSYLAYQSQQSGKGWKPVEVSQFNRASPLYSSLPVQKSQADRSRYLASTLDKTDSPASPIATRRVSLGSQADIITSSKNVRELIQKFSRN